MKNDTFSIWANHVKAIKKQLPFGPIKKIYNEDGKLHCSSGPASISPTRVIHYLNGRKHGIDADVFGSIFYYYENIMIPRHYFENPETLTVKEVLEHKNQEIRYVGLKLVGLDRLRDISTKIHSCKKSGMELFKVPGVFDEPISYLKVINGTAELDGTFKNYFLCVPPDIKTCKAAVAWTFGVDSKSYHPSQET